MAASATLTKFTVPIDSNQSAANQSLLMPKLKYRFRVTLEGFGTTVNSTELTKQIIDAKRPQAKFDDIVLDVYNSRIKLAGKPTWEDTTLTIRDDATGAVALLVGQQMQKQFDFYEQASAVSGQDYKFLMRIEILDGGNGTGDHAPNALETWELYGCFVSSADYGNLDYKESAAATISLTIRFDNALQVVNGETGPGIGVTVPRTHGILSTAPSSTL